QDVKGWYRGAPNAGAWDFLGCTREGYNFGASIEQNHRRNAPYASKWLTVTFASGSPGFNGMGDERILGRSSAISPDLTGLSGCTEKDPKQQVEGSRLLVNKLSQLQVI